MDIAVILIVVVIGTNKIVIKIEYFLIKFKGVQKMNNNDDVGIDELLKNVDLGKIQDNSNTKSNTTIVEEKRKTIEHRVEHNDNEKQIKNKVANKFNFVVMIVKCFGYLSAIIIFICFIQMDKFLVGLGCCVVLCVTTWLSTLIMEAIAEGLNLLQDIKNKL